MRSVLLHAPATNDSRTRGRTGWWAWVLQRTTGVLLVGYLFLHILVLSSARAGADTFDRVLGVAQHPVLAALDIVLMAILLFHAANGIRIMLLDAGIAANRQVEMFWASVAVTLVGVAASAWLSVPLIFR
ncbi:MAG: succinate dehydrogenase, cytochrome b556 subunit [SAR202 cluster bacterium]|nr:succinate dehydrogenase, cytochrome b556 subunit [SAR202 cluster bacterium]MDP6664343.1 succinate dehydrogenase, cytochrome b556 subunit [SAR202 cluster bacterium]MDP6798819.1 succinate dehydrogenase, cytochrome b556 subunit [SAR202 cluster bacterium]